MHNPPMTSAAPLLGLALFFSVSGVSGCGGLKDERPAKWSYISATIIQPQCATVNCHSAIAMKGAKAGGYDFHDVASGCASWSGTQVLRKNKGKVPRMPPDAPLPAADIELIEQWEMTPPPQGCDPIAGCAFNDADPNHGYCPPPPPPAPAALTTMFTVEDDRP